MPRALWWFRWGAMFTFLSGWLIILHRWGQGGFFAGSYGWAILLGGLLGSLMWANVWFVIWPNQKVVIQNAIDTAAGRPANPAAAGAGPRRARVADQHAAVGPDAVLHGRGEPPHAPGSAERTRVLGRGLAILLVVEVNALKGTPGQGAAKPLATVKGTLWAGFVLSVVYYAWFEGMR